MADHPAHPTETTITTALAPLRVRQLGSGPPAVLWHSLFVDSTTWCRVQEQLARHRRLILIDGPSHGQSGAVTSPFTLDDCAAAAVEVMDRLAVDGPVDWLGNAWGGHVGIVVAATHPGRCRTLTAIGTPVRALSGPERRKIRLLLAVYRYLGPAPLVTTLRRTLLGTGADPQVCATVDNAFRRADRKGMAAATRSVSLTRPDLTPIMPKVEAPTLFVAGADDAMATVAEAGESARHLPRGRVVPVPGAGHIAPLLHDAPALASLIIDFWDDPYDLHRTAAETPARSSDSPPAAPARRADHIA